MPLINCPDCKESVSDAAFKCPKCGVRLRKPTRTLFGKLIKYSLIAFNILMLAWLIGGMNAATKTMGTMSGAEQAGAAIGTGLGAMMIVVIWVIGDVILGLFTLLTRPKE